MTVITSYIDLKAQIKVLEEQAELARKGEIEAVIADIKLKMSEYGITLQDLGGFAQASKNSGVSKRSKAETDTNKVKPKKPVVAKYASLDGTKKWSGRGLSPNWVTAHVDAGGSLTDLLINATPS